MTPWVVLEDEIETRGHKRPANHAPNAGPCCDDATNCEWCFELVTSAEAKGLQFVTFQKFLDLTFPIAKEADAWVPESYKNPASHTEKPQWMRGNYLYTFSVTWDKGGMSGGNCWGDEAKPYPAEDEPDDPPIFDIILDKVFPTMTRLAYIRVKAAVWHEEDIDRDYGDYYGNYSREGIKGFNVKDLYDALVEEGYGK